MQLEKSISNQSESTTEVQLEKSFLNLSMSLSSSAIEKVVLQSVSLAIVVLKYMTFIYS